MTVGLLYEKEQANVRMSENPPGFRKVAEYVEVRYCH